MNNKYFQFGILFFTMFIDMMGFGIVMPILPRYVEVLGAAAWQIGLLVGVFSLAQLITLPFWGHLSDRIGRKPVLMISIVGTVLGYVIMGLTRSIMVMLLARALDGAAGGNMSVIQASISDITTPRERSRLMGALGAAYGFGFIFGPALGGWLSHWYGFATPMLITAALAGVNFLLIFIFFSETLQRKKGKEEYYPSLLEISQHVEKKTYLPAILTFFFFVLGFSMVMTLLVLFFYHRYGMNEQQIGYIFAMFGVIAIFIEGGLFGLISRRFGDRKLAILGASFLAVAFFFMPLTWDIKVAVAVCVLMALGDSLITPSLSSIVSHSTNEAWQGTAFGCYQSVGCLARCFGPILAGLLLKMNLEKTGAHYAQTAFWVASGLLLAALFCSLNISPKKS